MLKVEYSKILSQSKSDQEIVWKFNHPKGWERFHKFTSTNNSLSDCCNDISGVETSYEKWCDRLNSILKGCFSKRRIKCQNKYTTVESDS